MAAHLTWSGVLERIDLGSTRELKLKIFIFNSLVLPWLNECRLPCDLIQLTRQSTSTLVLPHDQGEGEGIFHPKIGIIRFGKRRLGTQGIAPLQLD